MSQVSGFQNSKWRTSQNSELGLWIPTHFSKNLTRSFAVTTVRWVISTSKLAFLSKWSRETKIVARRTTEFTVSTYSEFCDVRHFEFWKPLTWLITWLTAHWLMTHWLMTHWLIESCLPNTPPLVEKKDISRFIRPTPPANVWQSTWSDLSAKMFMPYPRPSSRLYINYNT